MTQGDATRVKVIFNRRAGRGRAARREERTRNAFAASGLEFDLEVTTGPGAARDMARRARRDGFSVVVAAGGDGTAAEVLNGLMDATGTAEPAVPVVLLPLGSGNDLAAATRSPRSPQEAAGAVRSGTLLTLDAGRVSLHTDEGDHSRFFHNSVGVGFEAQVNIEIASIRRGRGLALYLLGVLRALRRYTQPRLRVQWISEAGDRGELEESCFLVTAGNGPRIGGGFYLTPEARYDDGLLDLCVATAVGRLTIVRLLPKVLLARRITHPAVRIVRCRSFEISSEETFPVEADGEILATKARRVRAGIQTTWTLKT